MTEYIGRSLILSEDDISAILIVLIVEKAHLFIMIAVFAPMRGGNGRKGRKHK